MMIRMTVMAIATLERPQQTCMERYGPCSNKTMDDIIQSMWLETMQDHFLLGLLTCYSLGHLAQILMQVSGLKICGFYIFPS
ncbi:hypothetical protein DsansV1_C01g0004561 [Dioscorea sansibarensis]